MKILSPKLVLFTLVFSGIAIAQYSSDFRVSDWGATGGGNAYTSHEGMNIVLEAGITVQTDGVKAVSFTFRRENSGRLPNFDLCEFDSDEGAANSLSNVNFDVVWRVSGQQIKMVTGCYLEQGTATPYLWGKPNTGRGRDYVISLLQNSHDVITIDTGEHSSILSTKGFKEALDAISDDVL